MKFTHPNGEYEYVLVEGTLYLGEIDSYAPEGKHLTWISIGHFGGQPIQISAEEWPAFVKLINEIDEAIKGD